MFNFFQSVLMIHFFSVYTPQKFPFLIACICIHNLLCELTGEKNLKIGPHSTFAKVIIKHQVAVFETQCIVCADCNLQRSYIIQSAVYQ